MAVQRSRDPKEWSTRISPKLSLTGNFPNAEKPTVLKPSPCEVSLPAGSSCHNPGAPVPDTLLITGFGPRLRGSQVVKPHIAVAIIVPIWGSLSVGPVDGS